MEMPWESIMLSPGGAEHNQECCTSLQLLFLINIHGFGLAFYLVRTRYILTASWKLLASGEIITFLETYALSEVWHNPQVYKGWKQMAGWVGNHEQVAFFSPRVSVEGDMLCTHGLPNKFTSMLGAEQNGELLIWCSKKLGQVSIKELETLRVMPQAEFSLPCAQALLTPLYLHSSTCKE